MSTGAAANRERPGQAFRPADVERPSSAAASEAQGGSPPAEEGGVEGSLLSGMSRHVSDQQRAAAQRWACGHRQWCEQWRKPPPVEVSTERLL